MLAWSQGKAKKQACVVSPGVLACPPTPCTDAGGGQGRVRGRQQTACPGTRCAHGRWLLRAASAGGGRPPFCVYSTRRVRPDTLQDLNVTRFAVNPSVSIKLVSRPRLASSDASTPRPRDPPISVLLTIPELLLRACHGCIFPLGVLSVFPARTLSPLRATEPLPSW